MQTVPVLVEGITDISFLERLPGLQVNRLNFLRKEAGGQDQAKKAFASQINSGVKAILCLDIDDKPPEAKFAEVKEYLEGRGIQVLSSDSNSGRLGTRGGEVLFVPLGLWGDEDLKAWGVARHSFEDYLVKIALKDPGLRPPGMPHSVRECLTQIVSEYAKKGCSSLSGAQVYQLLKPLLGLPKHETGAISQFLKRAKQDIVKQTTRPVVERVNSFLASVGGEG